MSYILPFKGKTPKIDPSVFVAPTACIAGDVTVGKDSSIWFGSVIRGDYQSVTIGEGTNVQDNAVIHVMGDEPLSIGNHVIIGHGAMIHSHKIGDGTLIGMGSIVLGYTIIGENCIIGAGTLITQYKKIPANSLVYGNPAVIVRGLREDELEALAKTADIHSQLAEEYRKELEKKYPLEKL